MKKKLIGLLAACLLVTGCGSAAATNSAPAMDAAVATSEEWAYDDYYSDEPYYADEAAYDVAMEEGSATTKSVTFASNKKIIYSSSVVLETKTYTETYERLIDLIDKYKGYIEYENYNNEKRSYLKNNAGKGQIVIATNNLTIRIPSKDYSTFMKEGLTLGNVLNRNQSIEDKTSEYNTNKSYVDILNDEAEYLSKQLSVLESELKEAQANDKHYDDIIANMKDVAERKAQVEKELVPYKRVMDDIDEKVEYSTITMELREVNEFSEIQEEVEVETFGSRVRESWNNSIDKLVSILQGTVIFFINIIPGVVYLLIIAIVVFIIWKLVKLIKKVNIVQALLEKRKKNKEEKAKEKTAVFSEKKDDNEQKMNK